MAQDKKHQSSRLDEKEIREGAPFAALSYVFFLCIFVFISKRENRFAHYHVRQGIIIFLAEIVCICLPLVPLIGLFLYRVGILLCLAASLYGIYIALSGRVKRIPGVSELADKLVI